MTDITKLKEDYQSTTAIMFPTSVKSFRKEKAKIESNANIRFVEFEKIEELRTPEDLYRRWK